MNKDQLNDTATPRSVDQQRACSAAELSHAELIRLIGEIDGIDLEGHRGRLFVNLRIGGKTIELISDSSENPLHHITREGIRAVLSPPNVKGVAPLLARANMETGVEP